MHPRYISAMGFAFEGYLTTEFAGGTFSCAGGLAPELTAYIPVLLPNTTVIASPLVRNILINPGADCVVDLGKQGSCLVGLVGPACCSHAHGKQK